MTVQEWQDILKRQNEFREAQETHDVSAGDTKMENTSNVSGRWKRGLVAGEALNVINGMRVDAYGNPENSFNIIGNLMRDVSIIDQKNEFEPELLAVFNLICLKLGRVLMNPKDRDSWRDMIGYAALGCDIANATDADKD